MEYGREIKDIIHKDSSHDVHWDSSYDSKNISSDEKLERYLIRNNAKIPRPLWHKRYLDFKSWEEIADEMYMSVRSVYRKHSNFLKGETNDKWVFKATKKI